MVRPKTSIVNLAAIRAFRPRVLFGAGASLSRLSRRFDPSLFDKTMFASEGPEGVTREPVAADW